jgi:hypothetical protein
MITAVGTESGVANAVIRFPRLDHRETVQREFLKRVQQSRTNL